MLILNCAKDFEMCREGYTCDLIPMFLLASRLMNNITIEFINQMKICSSHLLDNLSNCLMNLKNSGDSTGFEPMTSAMPVQCSNQLSYELTQFRVGQLTCSQLCDFVAQLVMGLNPVESPEFFRFMRQLLKLSSKCGDRIFI